MEAELTTYQGRCLCSAVRFSVEVSKNEIGCCHCGMCRRWGGGPVLSVMADAPPIFDRETALGVYRSSEWGERVFCRTCGSSILWRSVDGKHQSVPVALLDDLEGLFTTEIFIDEKPSYYSFTGERTRMSGAEVMAAFGGDTDAT
ncbi:MAG: GFA family protein [Alphaproteobacteria bacterium]|nr:GFA family protein [Alphaproteobacteria bacterium]